ncbi:glycerate kinase [Oxynema sp. CENA135]|uniref:glycerate kinase n=1 Tax=Oxynema sp. CENA135 TaxID=984206 RepID=UPI00190A9A81|nr:glycerate kinase [Oxynema sp. CENA135]MBK4732399.1 glycerate kinase [Oxynema sp. CENA135]
MTDRLTTIAAILQKWARGEIPSEEAIAQLEPYELEDPRRLNAFGIDRDRLRTHLAERSRLFESVVGRPSLKRIDSKAFLPSLWLVWLPFAQNLARRRTDLGRPWIQGILGLQGTGKTTLTHILSGILAELDLKVLCLSVDDLYKTYRDRQQLQRQDPRLIWRGPPGTHDIDLGIAVLDRLRSPDDRTISVPRFDKSAYGGAGDRGEPEPVGAVDLVLFEGWFVGVRPIAPHHFDRAPWPIETDADRQFARDCNERLHAYLPLWDRLDLLTVLDPVDWQLSCQWRMQAEREMKARGRDGMSDDHIRAFVEYFWKALHPELFIPPLRSDRDRVDLILQIDRDRSYRAVY